MSNIIQLTLKALGLNVFGNDTPPDALRDTDIECLMPERTEQLNIDSTAKVEPTTSNKIQDKPSSSLPVEVAPATTTTTIASKAREDIDCLMPERTEQLNIDSTAKVEPTTSNKIQDNPSSSLPVEVAPATTTTIASKAREDIDCLMPERTEQLNIDSTAKVEPTTSNKIQDNPSSSLPVEVAPATTTTIASKAREDIDCLMPERTEQLNIDSTAKVEPTTSNKIQDKPSFSLPVEVAPATTTTIASKAREDIDCLMPERTEQLNIDSTAKVEPTTSNKIQDNPSSSLPVEVAPATTTTIASKAREDIDCLMPERTEQLNIDSTAKVEPTTSNKIQDNPSSSLPVEVAPATTTTIASKAREDIDCLMPERTEQLNIDSTAKVEPTTSNKIQGKAVNRTKRYHINRLRCLY
ncbi:hypothetical protein BDB00DRAFT_925667 [Zychaea mexicana]|uniref:uncharacterized protein n=1 Tax=Zychaea mexicana TaxID=64656 RepID=UPI0022FE1C67|nr:uncharacterized protein BDB00DRAFT_925667 [Zychaea mexicana]KAI9498007.1 hypothetical protein BDB00DRAFT_925667 [Zychaea mexicana]